MRSAALHGSRHHYDPVARLLGGGALAVSLIALVFAMTGLSRADSRPAAGGAVAAKKTPPKKTAKKKAKKTKIPTPSRTPKKNGLLLLNSKKKFPAAAIPKVAAAKAADTLDGATKEDLSLNCPATAVDLGSWCLDTSTYPLPNEDLGKNDFMYATKACVEVGGYLPSAAQLVGAAAHVKLASTIDDSQVTATTDVDATDGLKDQREMSSTLFTTTTGASAAGSQGVTSGSRGDPKQAEPDPVPFPADPVPNTVYYMTVYDNHEQGGFAGGQPLGQPERFRCAYDKTQGAAVGDE